jgi:isopenicillin N synthase-like dioxygenase
MSNETDDPAQQATAKHFDAVAKEQQLRLDSGTWDTSQVVDARPGDIPVIDLEPYFSSPNEANLALVAQQLKVACETVGFCSIIGHGVPHAQIGEMFDFVRKFHALPLADKSAIAMDRADWPVGGVGYLPVKHRKLPARDKGNLNEAFIVKTMTMEQHEHDTTNQWPNEALVPGFRDAVESYAAGLERLGKRLLPIFATALNMPPDFFDEAFQSPLYRLRMTHYPPQQNNVQQPVDGVGEFGIAPHVDTSFCTILAQDRPGLVIFSERRQQWIRVPLLQDALIVNSGELLRTWTNDTFMSVKHFANNNNNNNTGDDPVSRYSIPFFLNANSDYRMTCIPSCCGPGNPAKYPPISYAESQGVVQGE